MTDSIIFLEKNQTGIIILNRPKALNALNLEMANLFLDKLNKWKKDHNIKRILLKGEGKAFCAGGDVKSVFLSSGISNLKKEFFKKEYLLNYQISNFNKPYLSIWNGIVMGGGAGLSIYGSSRIATENAKFAMPETAIGFFPDVGASYFLSRIKKNIGLYIGLTGKVLSPEEMMYFGISTHYINNENLISVERDYINQGLINSNNETNKTHSELFDNIDFIEENFQGEIHSIIRNIKKSNLDFAKKIYEHLMTRCPMSLAITTKLYNKAKKLTLKECLEMEFQLSQKIVYREDFNNGVEAVLVSKTNTPKWKPSSLNEIKDIDLDDLFEIHIDKLGL